MPYGGKWERKFVPVDADKAAQDKAIAAGVKETTDVVVSVQVVQALLLPSLPVMLARK